MLNPAPAQTWIMSQGHPEDGDNSSEASNRRRPWVSALAAAGLLAVAIVIGIRAVGQSPAIRTRTVAPASQTPGPAASSDVSQTQTLSPRFGSPSNGELAIIDVDNRAGRITVETRLEDVTYSACSDFQATSVTGDPLGLKGLHPGDYAQLAVNQSAPCLQRVVVESPPPLDQCRATANTLPGVAVVSFVAFNSAAHSVLYRPSGPGEGVYAERWCDPPVVVTANGLATTLARISSGTQIKILGANSWITSISIVPP